MYDIVFCTLPVISIDQIYCAPPLLKGVVESAGFKAKCIDFGIELYKLCDKNLDQFTRIQNYFITKKLVLADNDQKVLDRWYNNVISTLANLDTRYIGFSVFSYWTHKATLEILLKLKQADLDNKVVLGGRGLKTNTSDVILDQLPNRSANDSLQWFGDVLKNKKLANHIIIGDGENAIVEFLSTQTISQAIYKTQGFDFPQPNYDDYNFDDYLWTNSQLVLQVKGSQGCVRDCDFCDIKVQFGDYQFKNGVQLAEEMIMLQQKHQVNKFSLVDSLSNGSMKHFREFISRLAKHNETSETKITWSGQYICRDQKFNDDYYCTLKLSGAEGLTIGAESGSNHVLKAMNKKTTVEALFYELEMFKKYSITVVLLTFSGHWSERHSDFIDHCRMLYRLVSYVKQGIVAGVSLGSSFGLIYETPSWHNADIIKSNKYYSRLWVAKSNRGNTLKVRMKRRMVLYKLAKILKLPVIEEDVWLQSEYDFLVDKTDEINEFFAAHAVPTDDIADIDQFIESLFELRNTEFCIELESSSCNSDPWLNITVNGQTPYHNYLSEGTHKLVFCVPAQSSNRLALTLTNKQPNDTEIDSTGKIIKDKFIRIKSLSIDNCDITKDIDFWFQHFQTDGLYFNKQTIALNFTAPFVRWYAANSKMNSDNWLENRNNSQVSAPESAVYSKLKSALASLIV